MTSSVGFGAPVPSSIQTQALESIDYRNKPFANKDFVENMQWLNQSVTTLSQYQQLMQKGIDSANQNIIDQIQSFAADLLVIFAGFEPTMDFQLGDVVHIFQAIGALMGITSDSTFPLDLSAVASHFFGGFIAPLPQFTDLIFESVMAWAEALGFSDGVVAAIQEWDDAIVALYNGIQDSFGNMGDAFTVLLKGLGLGSGQVNLGPFREIWDQIRALADAIVGGPEDILMNVVNNVIILLFKILTFNTNLLNPQVWLDVTGIHFVGPELAPNASGETDDWSVGSNTNTTWIWDADTNPTIISNDGSFTTVGNGVTKRCLTQTITACNPGDTYQLSGKIQWDNLNASDDVGLCLVFYTAANEISQSNVNIETGHDASGTWAKLYGEIDVPNDIDGFKLGCYVKNSITSGTIWIGDISCTVQEGLMEGVVNAILNFPIINIFVTLFKDTVGIDISNWTQAIINVLGWWTELFGDMNIFTEDFSIPNMLGNITNALIGWVGTSLGIDFSGWQAKITNVMSWWTEMFGDLNIFSADFSIPTFLDRWITAYLERLSETFGVDLTSWESAIDNVISWWTALFGDLNIFQTTPPVASFIAGLIENIMSWFHDQTGIGLDNWQDRVHNLLTWWTTFFGDVNIFDGNFQPGLLMTHILEALVEATGNRLGIDLSNWVDAIGNVLTLWTGLFADLNIFTHATDLSDVIGGLFTHTVTWMGNAIGISLDNWQDAIQNVLAWWTDLFGDMNIFSDTFDITDLLSGLANALTGFMVHGVGDLINSIFIKPIISIFTGSSSKTDLTSLGASVNNIVTRGSPIAVSQLQGRIPHTMLGTIPVSNITEVTENLLDPLGGFDLSTSISSADENWVWDSAQGYGTSTGSAKLTLDGSLHQLFTRVAVPVSELDILSVSCVVKTSSFVGSGTPIRLSVIPFVDDTQGETVVIASTGQALDWTLLKGDYTADEGVTSIFVVLEALSTATSGTVNWDSVSVVKTGKMRQSLVDKLEDMWDHTTEIIDDGLDINPFDADTVLFKIWSAFRIQHDSVIGANATIEQLRTRITVLESPGKAIAVDDFERTGNLTPVWNVTEIGSGDGNIQLDGHHAYWSPSIGLADDNYALCRFIGGGAYGDQYSTTAYQYITVTVNSGPFKLSTNSPAIDLLAMIADDNSSLVRARWDGKGNLKLSYLQTGTYYDLGSTTTEVPSGGTVLGLKVGILENGTPNYLAVYQNSKTKIGPLIDGSYSVHSYRNNRGWGFGMYARGTPLLGQYLPGSLHQWTANDQ